MSFAESIKSLFTNCFKVSGRASRSEFWWSWLFVVLVSIVLYVLCVTAIIGGALSGSFAIAGIAWLLLLIWYLFISISLGICMLIRRLHDSNKSGWWWLLALIPFGGIVLLIFALMPSSVGNNDYGS